jgi:hypothetical protein
MQSSASEFASLSPCFAFAGSFNATPACSSSHFSRLGAGWASSASASTTTVIVIFCRGGRWVIPTLAPVAFSTMNPMIPSYTEPICSTSRAR